MVIDITAALRLEKDLQNGLCLMRTGQLSAVVEHFSVGLGNPNLVINVLRKSLNVDIPSQILALRRGLKSSTVLEDGLPVVEVLEFLPADVSESQKVKVLKQIAKLSRTKHAVDEACETDIVTVVMLALDVSWLNGKIHFNEFQELLSVLVKEVTL
jgi:hypothetical protein